MWDGASRFTIGSTAPTLWPWSEAAIPSATAWPSSPRTAGGPGAIRPHLAGSRRQQRAPVGGSVSAGPLASPRSADRLGGAVGVRSYPAVDRRRAASNGPTTCCSMARKCAAFSSNSVPINSPPWPGLASTCVKSRTSSLRHNCPWRGRCTASRDGCWTAAMSPANCLAILTSCTPGCFRGNRDARIDVERSVGAAGPRRQD